MVRGTAGLNNCQFLQCKIEVEAQIAADVSKFFEIAYLRLRLPVLGGLINVSDRHHESLRPLWKRHRPDSCPPG